MNINRTTLTVLAIGVFVLGAVIPVVVATQIRVVANWIIDILKQSSGGQSPVRVLGGSTTFESDYGWRPVSGCAPSNPDTCSYVAGKNAPQDFIAVHIYLDSQNLTFNVSGKPWTIATTEYNADGMRMGAAGATMCGSIEGATCDTSTAGRYVLVTPDPSGSFFGLDVPPILDVASFVGKRYHSTNQNCHIERGDYCDHLASVTVAIKGVVNATYRCPLGRCVVGVDSK